MGRLLIGPILVFLWVASAAAADAAAVRTVDLNEQGALEAVQRARPAHFEKIGKLLNGLTEQPHIRDAKWVQTTFSARNVTYADMYLVSLPSQRRLSFTLDDTQYRVTLTQTNNPAHVITIRNAK